jgi:RND family efflux transporter MFP subunit
MLRSILVKLLILPPIALALMVVSWMNNQPQASGQEREEIGFPVSFVNVRPRVVSAEARGFGRVETTRSWSGVAEVEGRLVVYDDDLQVGTMVSAGDLLFEIDPRDYQINVAQREADVLRAQADIQALQVNASNSKASLDVERKILEIYRTDRDRIEKLIKGGSVAATELDSANRTFLSQQSAVTSLEASLALVAPDLRSAGAALAKAQADLESAERDLARTRVVAPLDGSVSERGASASEYVRPGDTLITLEAVDTVEIKAAFQPSDFAQLVGGALKAGQLSSSEDANDAPLSRVKKTLQAQVIAQFGRGITEARQAKITRVTGQIDESTGAIGVVVQVENTARKSQGPAKPPLISGGFVEVILTGPPIENVLLVPERALRYEGDTTYLYVADTDNRLVRRDVITGTVFGDQVEIREGLIDSARVVLSDPSPATLGLLLNLVEHRSQRP